MTLISEGKNKYPSSRMFEKNIIFNKKYKKWQEKMI